MRGFIRGVLWGSVAAVGGVVVVSQVVGPVRDPKAAVTVALPADAPAPVATDKSAPSPAKPTAPAVTAEAEGAQKTVTPPVAQALGEDVVPAPSPVLPGQPPAAPVAAKPEIPSQTQPPKLAADADAPLLPKADAPAASSPAPAEPPVVTGTETPDDAMTVAQADSQPAVPLDAAAVPPNVVPPATPDLPAAETAPKMAELPVPPPVTSQDEALLTPVPQPTPKGEATAPMADPTPEVVTQARPLPQVEAPFDPDAGNRALDPAAGLGDQAAGVVTDRLPRIGDAPSVAEAPVAEVPADVPDPALDESLPPLQRFARAFENPAQKPLFAILLVDNGQDDVDRLELAALDIPLTIVIDPLSEGAAERAAIWRAGGQEIVMAGTGIPQGASAGDLEQSFQVLAARLPEAVAVIDPDGKAFQNDRPLSSQVVPIVEAQGRGLVTFDQGLNAADQVARREGLATATIFRRIDGEGEDSPVIRRYLDRAAFRAAQEGRVVVIGDLRPTTVAGVLEWTIEGRASTMALAPISALLAEAG